VDTVAEKAQAMTVHEQAVFNRLVAIFIAHNPELSNQEILKLMQEVDMWWGGDEILINRGREVLFVFPEAWIHQLPGGVEDILTEAESQDGS
jgi:hypothetical protein